MPCATLARAPERVDPSPKVARLRGAGLLALLLLVLAVPRAEAATGDPPKGRLVVLGFDGADARIAGEMMDRGELPHLARLRAEGTFAPLATTVPAESPVSWASLNSGQNPAKTGIPGFVKRVIPPGRDPSPRVGFYEDVERETASLKISPLLRFLVTFEPRTAGLLAAVAVLAVFSLLFVLLLRIRKSVALPLALVLGAAGGWAGFKASSEVPRRIPGIVANLVQTGGFWEVAARAGVPSVVLDGAMTWDRPEVPGAKVLSGLGVPDVRGAYGDWFVYTADASEMARQPEGRGTNTGGTVFRVDEVGGRIDALVFGPLRIGGAEGERLTVPLVVEHAPGGKSRLTIDGVDHEIAEGEWSPWYRLVFEMTPLVRVHAITRAKLLRSDPFVLYLDFLQIDPSSPPPWQPVSEPRGYAKELARATGSPFETVGWACLTMPYKDREIEPATFLEDVDATRAGRERLCNEEIAKADWRLFMCVESTPDRVQHMMYQFYDKEHPKYDAGKAQARARFGGEEIALADAIPAAYRQMDRFVGEVMEKHLRPGTR